MRKAILGIIIAALGLWWSIGTSVAADINLSPSDVGFHSPTGIDFQDTSGQLILAVNYPTGSPNNLELADPVTGTSVPFSSLANLTNEVLVTTVRSGSCQGGFTDGESFTGNGIAGQIVRISADGTSVQDPWVTLPGETALLRGSLFHDRFCAADGDLIVATGNEPNGTCPNDCVGNVWRITSAGVATQVATIGVQLEGLTTLPNDPGTYGPAAGRILAGAEGFIIPGGPTTYDPTKGLIIAVNPNATNDFFTIGGPGTTGFPGHTHYLTTASVHPEDLKVIRANAQFFGVAFRDGEILTAAASDFVNRCGQILIPQEFPFAGTSGLNALRWDSGSGSFILDVLTSNLTIQQWEHITFTAGQDCFGIKVAKSPKQGDPGSVFTSGSQVSFTIVVTATGANDDTNVVLTDQLPGNGGLVWSTATASNGAPCGIASNLLTCNLGTVHVGTPVTVTVKSTVTTPAAACQNQPNPDAHVTADHGLTADDSGVLTCTPPPQLKVVKSPKNGTFTQGGQTSFSIVVSNPAPAGSGSATNVTLTDQLPGNGGLVWTNVSINPAQGGCTLTGNLLSCSLGTIAAGGSVTVTVRTAATTPAAACQSQPNPDAHATADGGLVADDSGSLTCTPPANLVTVTQGGWHAPPHGNNPGTVLNAYFTAHPGYAPEIGDITNACGGKTLTFTSANAIRAFLPAGGTPGVLTATKTNPTSSSAGVFAGQVLALTLNTQVLSSGSSLLSFVITSGPAMGKTVGQVLADANKALGGCGLPSYVSTISQLNDIVDSINGMFDNG